MSAIWRSIRVIVCAAIIGCLGGPMIGWADTADTNEQQENQAAASSSAQATDRDTEGQDKGREAVEKEREKLVKEAVTALRETEHALKALEKKNTEEALSALSTVIGKLGIILARDPKLRFVPVDVEMTSIDILADEEKVKEAIEEVRDFLDQGEVQKARRLLNTLGSELVISTLSLPLATYPDAIKAIVPLIDQGKIEEAKQALQAVLDTLVVTNRIVIPLPILRAEFSIQQAEQLAKELETPTITSAEGSGEEKPAPASKKEQILDLLKSAHAQLRLAEVLGYGLEEKRYAALHEQIEAIEQKIGAEESTEGLFSRLRKALSDFTETFTGGEE